MTRCLDLKRINIFALFDLLLVVFTLNTFSMEIGDCFLGNELVANGVLASESEAKYAFDARTGQYRDLATGRFVSPRDLPWPSSRGFASNPVDTTL